MKYGILTFHNIPNYGAAFQALALCEAMQVLGADCEIIDYKCENITHRELEFKKSNNPIITTVKYFIAWLPRKKRIRSFHQFMSEQQIISTESYNKETISQSNEKYDAFISGSDMVWDLKITDRDYTFMLDFVDAGKKRFSYGSSSGSEWESDTEDVISYLSRYDFITVRESNVQKNICSHNLDCKLVADPTILMNSDYWAKLANNSKTANRKRRYVLVYFAYKKILAAAKKYANENHLDLIVISDYRKPFHGYKILKIFRPEDWLKAFLNAEIIFTDSYHGVLFSMMFHKQFWTNNRCNRIESILNVTGLSNRFIDCGMSSTDIDYSVVDEIIDAFRNESRKYLSEVIDMCRGDFE